MQASTARMNTEDVLNEFRDAGALREGHFVLSSGLHSPVFLQKNLVFMDGARCERLCKALAEKITALVGPVDVAISPAVGGIITIDEMHRPADDDGCRRTRNPHHVVMFSHPIARVATPLCQLCQRKRIF